MNKLNSIIFYFVGIPLLSAIGQKKSQTMYQITKEK